MRTFEIYTGEDRLVKTLRSEERRVGKECRSRWSRYHEKKKKKNPIHKKAMGRSHVRDEINEEESKQRIRCME